MPPAIVEKVRLPSTSRVDTGKIWLVKIEELEFCLETNGVANLLKHRHHEMDKSVAKLNPANRQTIVGVSISARPRYKKALSRLCLTVV